MNTYNRAVRRLIHLSGNLLRALKIFYLKQTGVVIGKNCMISLRAKIDVRRGRVFIGDNCTITYGAVILSHDRASMLIHPHESSDGRVVIGNNVFIGVNTVIMMNVTIGDNSIIGAGSVVTGDIPADSIAMGNPARVIRKI